MINLLTIQQPIEDEIEIRKSRFITYLIPIENEDEFHQAYDEIKKQHPKATHHCYAYILEGEQIIQRMSDDGEPSGTAGVPMLEVLQKNNLNHIMAVCVRYFGGVKLGAGGLIRAYSSSVSSALDHATIVAQVDQQIIELSIAYEHNDTVFHYLSVDATQPIQIIDTEYTEQVRYQLALFPHNLADFTQQINNLTHGQGIINPVHIQQVRIPAAQLEEINS